MLKTVLTIIIPALTLLVAFFDLPFFSRRKKRFLFCRVHMGMKIYESGYHRRPRVCSRLFHITVINKGREAVLSKYLTDCITIGVSQSSKYSRILPTDVNAKGICPSIQNKDKYFTLDFDYLNPKDYIEFAVWTSDSGSITFDQGRMVDGSIKTVKTGLYSGKRNWLYSIASGIINGYEDGTFKPNNNLTRAEAAKIMSVYMNKK